MAKVIIGSHVSMKAPSFYVGSIIEALSYEANTFMFYTGAPQNSFRIPVERLKIAEGRALLKEHGFDESKIIVHAPYIINLANIDNSELYKASKSLLINELQRVAAFGLNTLVLHPGSHVGLGTQKGLDAIVNALDEVFENDGTNVHIALETMSGKGSELGTTFEQLDYLIKTCKYSDRLGVCLDTCHISDYGYDLNDIDALLSHFDKIVGLNKLLCIHINDSKNEKGSHKDRHENIGYGTIGFDTIYKIVHHPLLVEVPKILETPYIEKSAPYKEEIAMLKSGNFTLNWKESK